ncbi:hypothetical protein NP233_g6038 [Leucocoprinus birnbaumii]|uniref:SUZ domain-containing protein n=1 Tax=Leucocoprinus birnbaumii TaxID=56174 RepID=A0AAD5YVX1_9AGAR|nr:hypothetical protein NP233_g6038 [Leucocoprinus birnbaumii]
MATSLNSSSKPPLDAWDNQTGTKSSRKAPITQVRDDWEDDDEDDVGGDEIVIEDNVEPSPRPSPPTRARTLPNDEDKNKKIWEAANKQVVTPMPTLVSTRTGSVIPPPAAAFQPAMRILKRPSSSSPSQNSSVTSPPPGETLQEREARYAAARERIFGSESSESLPAAPKPTSPNNVKIIREPKAPDTSDVTQSVGFKGRGGKTASPGRSSTGS